MLKYFNIAVLMMFLGFLSTPTILAIQDVETPFILIAEEEENETHKNKFPTAEEEEEIAIDTKFYSQFLSETITLQSSSKNFLSFEDPIFSIPLPPPEHV